MNLSNRRVFMMTLAAGTSALASSAALAQAKLDEKDPQAVALGYVADTTKADTKKFPKHSNDQKCSNCQLFQGKADRRDWRLPAVRRQGGRSPRLVQRLGEEGLRTRRRCGRPMKFGRPRVAHAHCHERIVPPQGRPAACAGV